MKVVRDVQYCVSVVRMSNEGSAGRTVLKYYYVILGAGIAQSV